MILSRGYFNQFYFLDSQILIINTDHNCIASDLFLLNIMSLSHALPVAYQLKNKTLYILFKSTYTLRNITVSSKEAPHFPFAFFS